MDHSEALELKAAERYLLGDLTGVQRQEYEEHFFGCPECAQALGLGVVFIENARDILAPEAHPAPASVAFAPEKVAPVPEQSPKQTPKQSWFAVFLRPAFAAAALALLAFVIVYQGGVYQGGGVTPQFKTAAAVQDTPQVLAAFSLLAQSSRGRAPAGILVPRDRPIGLFIDIPPIHPFAFYDCQFQDADGKLEFSLKVSAEEARQTVELFVPPSRLQPGQHVLVVRGLDSSQGLAGPEVVRFPFSLSFSN